MKYLSHFFILAFFYVVLTAAKPPVAPLCIIHTNDVHGYIYDSLSYDAIPEISNTLKLAGANVIVMDAGDFMQGTVYNAWDKGRHIIDIMNRSRYDVVTPGNHEFDYGLQVLDSAVAHSDFSWVSCNLWRISDGGRRSQYTQAYRMFSFPDYKVAVVGITTPETIMSSLSTFTDVNGEKICDITYGDSASQLYADVQAAVDRARMDGADYVVALGHLGIDSTSCPFRSTDVISHTNGIDAFIDGHSHSVVSTFVKAKDGHNVLLAQTGTAFSNIGVVTLVPEGYWHSFMQTSSRSNPIIRSELDSWIHNIDSVLSIRIGECAFDFYIKNADGTRAVRRYETNAGDFCADALWYYANNVDGTVCDLAMINGACIRSGVPAGEWTYKTAKTMEIFDGDLCIFECTGKTILEILEWGSILVPEAEMNTLMQVAGLTYQINPTVTSTVQINKEGEWIGRPTEKYRVNTVMVYDRTLGIYRPLEPDRVYRICGMAYNMVKLNEGFRMLTADSKYRVIKPAITKDYWSIISYVSAFEDTDDDGLPDISSDTSPLRAYKGYIINYEDRHGSFSRLKVNSLD